MSTKTRIAAVGTLVLFLISWINSPASSGQDVGPEYVPDQIIVKFKRAVVDTLERQLAKGTQVNTLTLSSSLDQLNRRHKVIQYLNIWGHH